MATQKTQIAEQLERIEAAKETLLGTAITLGLDCYDPEDGKSTIHAITEISDISELSWGFSQIPYYPHGASTDPDGNPNAPYHANTEGVTVNGPNVLIDEGYYSGSQQATVTIGSTETPTVSIDPASGKITVTKKQTEGYISGGEMSYDAGTVQHDNLVAENIKPGTTIFGISGAFTNDATLEFISDDGKHESGLLLEGYTAYAKGLKVEGTVPLMSSEETIFTLDPLTQNGRTPISKRTCVESVKIELTPDLLNRLAAI